MNIEHIDQVLPSIKGRDEFVVAERPGYKVIDYNFAMSDSFDDPIRLELRGIKFDASGKILARPFQKFFNVGERVDTQPDRLDFLQPHVITQKLDGSMIHPAIVDGALVLMTRIGRTDVAVKAERHLTDDLEMGLRHVLSTGITPIFEFTAPDNRIVIRYDKSELTLLAAREMVSGRYVEDLPGLANALGVPLVKHLSSEWTTGPAFLDYARAVVGEEGFVVRFASGLWVKAKGDDYVLKHKAKESILQEKNVLAMIVGGQLDDVLPLLETEDREAIEVYRDNVLAGIGQTAERVDLLVRSGAHLDQKTFAVEHLKGADAGIRSMAFSVRAGADPKDAIAKSILKHVSSQTTVDMVRGLHGAQWPL